MSKTSYRSYGLVKGCALPALSSMMLFGAPVYGAVVPGGSTHTIDNSLPSESWTLQPGSTLISNGADTLAVVADTATFNATGANIERLEGQRNSTFNITNAAISLLGGGRAISISDSVANLSNTQVSSDDIGLNLIRNVSGQIGSKVFLTNASSVSALNGGALATGFSEINLSSSSITGTSATSYGARISNADLKAVDSRITGGLNGLQIGRETNGARTSTVTLDSTTVEGKSGSAIVVGFQDRSGITANIDLLNGSRLIGANGTILEVNDAAAVNFSADRSDLVGNVVVESGSSAAVTLKNGATLNGNLQNVAQVNLSAGSMTGDVLADIGNPASVQLANGSSLNGNLRNVANVSVDGSTLTGNVHALSGAGAVIQLSNQAVLQGGIFDSARIAINNGAQWNMSADSTVQQLELSNGVVQMGTHDQFQQLNVVNLSGNGTFVMGTDLGTGQTDFLNVTGNATGQHQLQIAATGTTPVTAEAVKVGNIAAGDASFSLGGRETVDAGTFVYRLAKEGQGLYLNPDKETVSTSSNTALALAGSARSVLNAEAAMLSDQLGDRSLSIRPEASLRAMDDSSMKLSNSVWVRTYGNQYNVDNAYGDGYTQNQTGITGGADTVVDIAGRAWVLGGFVGTSRTDIDLKYGSSAIVDSVNAGVYGSTFDVDSGVFVNLMAKVNQFDNKAKVTMSDGTRTKGDYKSLGLSGSAAIGKHIRLKDDYFVEPQVQISTGVAQSDEYRLDNGLQVKADTMRSVQGKVGVRGGRVFTLDNGSLLEPSLSTAFNHEFVKTNEVKINDDSFDDDRASSSVEYGAGLKWTPAQRTWQVSGQVGGSKGTTVSQDWSGSLRVSYFF